MFAASIALGLTAGAVASVVEKRGLLDGQARFVAAPRQDSPASRLAMLPKELLDAGGTGGRLLATFIGFAFIGFARSTGSRWRRPSASPCT